MSKNKGLISALASYEEKTVYVIQESLAKKLLEETDRSNYISAVLPDKDFISFNFELSKELLGEELDDNVEIKMYQDAGLNPLLEYKIVYSYVYSKLDPASVHVQAFAVSLNVLKGQLDSYIKQYGYIDIVAPSETLPLALYNGNILEPANDIYLYFEKELLMVSIFTGGKFLYSKEIDFGLKKLLEIFIKTTGEVIKYDYFVSMLISKGLNSSLYSEEDRRFLIDFTDLFNSVFSQVNSIIQYSGRMYGIDVYDRVFIGTQSGLIPKITEFSKENISIDSFDYIFFTNFYFKEDDYIDQRHILLLLELQNAIDKKQTNPFNASINKRPSSFFKRPSGKLISISLLGALLFLLYPLYLFVGTVIDDYTLNTKLKELKFSQKEFVAFQNIENTLVEERSRLKINLEKERKLFDSKMKLLKNTHDKKISKSAKVYFINNLFKEIAARSMKIAKFTLKENTAIINLEAKNQRNITDLVEILVKQNYTVDMDIINFDSKQNRYITSIKVQTK